MKVTLEMTIELQDGPPIGEGTMRKSVIDALMAAADAHEKTGGALAGIISVEVLITGTKP